MGLRLLTPACRWRGLVTNFGGLTKVPYQVAEYTDWGTSNRCILTTQADDSLSIDLWGYSSPNDFPDWEGGPPVPTMQAGVHLGGVDEHTHWTVKLGYTELMLFCNV